MFKRILLLWALYIQFNNIKVSDEKRLLYFFSESINRDLFGYDY